MWGGGVRDKRDPPSPGILMVGGGILEGKGTSPLLFVVEGRRFRGERDHPEYLRLGWMVLEAKWTCNRIIRGWRSVLDAKGTSPPNYLWLNGAF